MKIVVDSNIWIALLDDRDSQHKKALSFFETISDGIILVPEYVMLEVCSVLKQHRNKQTADLFIRRVFEQTSLHLYLSNEIFFENTLQTFLQASHGDLSFIDVSLLYLSRHYPIHTFDKKLANAIKKQKR